MADWQERGAEEEWDTKTPSRGDKNRKKKRTEEEEKKDESIKNHLSI